MIQSLHIFRKDVRHLWPEITIYVGLLIAFAWVVPQIWEGAGLFNSLFQIFVTFLRALIPIIWLVMTVRLIQDESIVGDQQFWITRPYKWTSLLGAKLLFIVVGIILPFVAMQWFLLFHAGLHPFGAIPGLLLNLLYFTLLCWLPFTAVAAVTSTFPRAAMSIIGPLIVLIAGAIAGDNLLGLRLTPPFVDGTLFTVFAILLCAILVWQYATRHTTEARIVLIATPILLAALFFAAPADLLFHNHYPIPTDASAPHLIFDSDPLRQEQQVGKPATFGNQFDVNLPAQLESLDPTTRLGSGALSFIVDAPGYHYVSPWLPATFNAHNIAMLVPQDVVRRLHGTSVHLHLSLVSERLLPGAPQTVTADDRFDVPSKGNCVFLTDMPGSGPFCRYPFQSPPPTRVTGPIAAMPPCAPGAPTRPGAYEMHANSLQPSFDPVIQEPLGFGGTVCPGTQLTFTTYQSAGNLRLELDIPAIILDHYVAHIDLSRRSQGMPSTAPPAPQPGDRKVTVP